MRIESDRMCKTIKQKVKFKAPTKEIYQLLTDSHKFKAFTGKRASISKNVGGPFSVYSGNISGINVDLVPGKRVVQAWRGSNFPAGIFSMASFNLVAARDGGTELTLIHRGVPKELIPTIEKKWRTDFWDKIKNHLA